MRGRQALGRACVGRDAYWLLDFDTIPGQAPILGTLCPKRNTRVTDRVSDIPLHFRDKCTLHRVILGSGNCTVRWILSPPPIEGLRAGAGSEESIAWVLVDSVLVFISCDACVHCFVRCDPLLLGSLVTRSCYGLFWFV